MLAEGMKKRDALFGLRHDNPEQNGEFKVCDLFNPIIETYIDIGAKRGDFLEKFNCYKIAFEPDVRNNKRLNKLSDEYYVFALSNTTGYIDAWRFMKDNKSDNDYFYVANIDFEDPLKKKAYYKKRELQVAKLDDFKIKNKKTFIKIDTEGMEYKILKGAKEFIEETNNLIIMFEYSWHWANQESKFLDAFKFLRERDFIITRVTPFGLIRIDNYFPTMENVEYCNYLAFRNIKPCENVYKVNDMFGLDANDYYSFEEMKPEWV